MAINEFILLFVVIPAFTVSFFAWLAYAIINRMENKR